MSIGHSFPTSHSERDQVCHDVDLFRNVDVDLDAGQDAGDTQQPHLLGIQYCKSS